MAEPVAWHRKGSNHCVHRRPAFAELAPAGLVQALAIRYDPLAPASAGTRRDRVFEHVVGLSLGAPASMRFPLTHRRQV